MRPACCHPTIIADTLRATQSSGTLLIQSWNPVFANARSFATFGSKSSTSLLLDSFVSFLASHMLLTQKVTLVKTNKFTKTQVVCTTEEIHSKTTLLAERERIFCGRYKMDNEGGR